MGAPGYYKLPLPLGRFSNDDGDGNGNVKKAIGLINIATTRHMRWTFLYIFCRHCRTRIWNFLIEHFMEEVNTWQQIFLSNLGLVSKNSTLENFTYIWHLKQVGIIATMFEKNWIHFNSDVCVAVTVVIAKASYNLMSQLIYDFFFLTGCTATIVWISLWKTLWMLLREGLVCQEWRVRLAKVCFQCFQRFTYFSITTCMLHVFLCFDKQTSVFCWLDALL